MPINYGLFANATSLNTIVRKLFNEFGKIMNDHKSLTITASLINDIGIGDVNQHFDCVSVPNMGGYQFPPDPLINSKNLFVGVVGIDEVVLGSKVFRSKPMWDLAKPKIEKEIKKWHTKIDNISKVHVSTNSDKDQIIEYLKVPEEKIELIPYGVDHELFNPPNDKKLCRRKILSKFFLKNNPYFIHIGEVNWARKNIPRLLEAFRKGKSMGLKQNLIIVGQFDPFIVKKSEHIPGVIILGFVSQEHLIDLIRGADAMITPSLHEGFGLPIVESMACGVPVIASNIFSPPELMEDAGLLVDPYDTNAISKAIVEIAKNEKLRVDLSKKALKRSQYYSWDSTAKKMLELFQKNITIHDDGNFDENYDLAAFRTLVTISQVGMTNPDLKYTSTADMVQLNFSRMIRWCLEVGIYENSVKDFIYPFKNWLEEHSN